MKISSLKNRHIVFLGIILFFVLVLFAAPRIGRYYIVRHSNELIGRNLDIKKIRFNYFSGTLKISDLVLYENDSDSSFLRFSKLKVNLDYLPLFRDEIFIRYVALDDPYVQVLQDGSKFNFSDMTVSDTTEVQKDTIPSQPAKYIINNISISRGYVKYTDVAMNHTIALNALDLLIPGFTWNSDSTNLDVDFRFVDGGGLYSSLSLNQADSTYMINLRLDSLNLDIVEPYVKSSLNVSALHGYLSNDIMIKGSMTSVMNLFISGVNHINGFQLVDTLQRTILSFSDLTIDIDTLQPDKGKVKLDFVGVTDPFVMVELIDTTNNWVALLKHSSEVPADTLEKSDTIVIPENEGDYSFSRLEIKGGQVVFSDKTMRYPFEYKIDDLEITSAVMPDAAGKQHIHVSALLNETGSFITDVTMNPSNLSEMEINLSIGQFRMKDVEAYFKHYFGFPVSSGIMNFKTENEFLGESLVSNNSIYFRKFNLLEKTERTVEYNLPLRLALGVLSDKDGIIDLKAPVEMHGEEVKIKYLWRTIFRVVGNLFVKAAVSPFNLLAGEFNADPAALQKITLNLFEVEPDKESMMSVDAIAEILNKKPGLNVDFYYSIDNNNAADTLAYHLVIKEYNDYSKNTGIRERYVADTTLRSWLLEKALIQEQPDDNSIMVLCRKYIGDEKIRMKLDSIKSLQTGFLRSYLISDKAISEERFRIFTTTPDSIVAESGSVSFRTYITAGSVGETPRE